MKLTDEAVEALSVSLIGAPWATFDEGLRNTLRAIHREALEAALPHLTDDGAAAPGGAPGNASAFGPSTGATPTAAPSSPHLEDWTEEERGFVEIALSAADSGNAGHWPTVATYLAAEVRRLRASEGATPAIDREALRRLAEGWTDLDTPGLAQPANQDWASGVDQGYSNAAAELLALIEGAS